MGRIFDDMPLTETNEVAVMVNGLGSTPLMELFIVNRKVHKLLEEKGVKVYKTLVGEYMTSIEMSGFSISVLKLDEELKELLSAPADTPAFKEF
jgi:dihydroxyacetone kinase-like protein